MVAEKTSLIGRARALLSAPLVFLLICELLDLITRWPDYVVRIEYLTFRAGMIKTYGAYGLALATTLLTLVALFSIPKIGSFVVGSATTALYVLNMGFYLTLAHYLNAEDVRILQNADPNAYRGAVFSYWKPQYWPYLVVAATFIPLAWWLGRRWPVAASFDWRWRTGAIIAAAAANFFLWDYLYIKCNDFPVEAVTSTLRTAFYVEKERREFLSVEREVLPPIENIAPPADNIVLIIDESVRVDYISINSSTVATTPFLAELAQKPGFKNYGVMISSTTCSFTAKSLMFTGTTVAPDTQRLAMSNPTIFQQAKRYGYRTVILDGPGRNFPNIVIRESDLEDSVDILERGYQVTNREVKYYDLALADRVHQLLTERPTGNFIVLIKVGAHFHYETSYPGDEPKHRRFLPKLDVDESYGSSRERTINSYKNALTFTVDTFFEKLFSKTLPSTTILYTSDHGQSLQEHGQTYTHCKDEIEQAVVPFFIISDVPWVLENAGGTSFVLMHHNLYPSMVSIFAKQREVLFGGYNSLFSANLTQPPLGYFYGGIWANSRTIVITPEQALAFLRGKPN
jgi:glucan phosphoethanolaminetransferase (alkaline phosphatase superfamily)